MGTLQKSPWRRRAEIGSWAPCQGRAGSASSLILSIRGLTSPARLIELEINRVDLVPFDLAGQLGKLGIAIAVGQKRDGRTIRLSGNAIVGKNGRHGYTVPPAGSAERVPGTDAVASVPTNFADSHLRLITSCCIRREDNRALLHR